MAHSKGTVHHRRKARWQEHEAAGHNESVLKMQTTAKCIEHFNSNAQEAKTGRALQVRGQPGLHGEFQVSQDYIVKPCLKKQKL